MSQNQLFIFQILSFKRDSSSPPGTTLLWTYSSFSINSTSTYSALGSHHRYPAYMKFEPFKLRTNPDYSPEHSPVIASLLQWCWEWSQIAFWMKGCCFPFEPFALEIRGVGVSVVLWARPVGLGWVLCRGLFAGVGGVVAGRIGLLSVWCL